MPQKAGDSVDHASNVTTYDVMIVVDPKNDLSALRVCERDSGPGQLFRGRARQLTLQFNRFAFTNQEGLLNFICTRIDQYIGIRSGHAFSVSFLVERFAGARVD